MVLCCVPSCGEEIWRCDPSVTFHEFPANPVLSAKWMKQIQAAMKSFPTNSVWVPKEKPIICSKHFLQTDFKEDTDTLKPFCIPTVFGHKFIGFDQQDDGLNFAKSKKSPLIVKVNRPSENTVEAIANCPSENIEVEPIVNCPPEIESNHTITNALSVAAEVPQNETPKPIYSYSKAQNNAISHLTSAPQIGNQKMVVKANQPSSTSVQSTKTPTQTAAKPTKVIQSKDCVNKSKKRKASSDNNLIEIGPNTFLKINPEIIKVNKRQTPTGNTVLQFIMNQKMANSKAAKMLPTLIQSVANPKFQSKVVAPKNTQSSAFKEPEKTSDPSKKDTVVEHVVGHLVDTHVCKDTCSDKLDEDCEDMILDETEPIVPNGSDAGSSRPNPLIEGASSKAADVAENGESSGKSSSNVLSKAPVLFTTSLPISHCLLDKTKYLSQMRQKQRQIASMKFKIASLTKKVEELEDRCIVQERQLSYSFIKRLKAIRKNASNGDPCATYILEQIRCYSGKTKMRWSDSTLSQCAVWCRKAPYAYEYFKKADFFKLPCLGTVKRFMKKHPEYKFQSNKPNGANADDDDSSSDFDFDESDSGNEQPDNSDAEKQDPPSSTCDTTVGDTIVTTIVEAPNGAVTNNPTPAVPEPMDQTVSDVQDPNKDDKSGKVLEMNAFPIAVDGSSLEVQEIILPSGEVVQCYSSSLCNGDSGNQYYIIPNVGDQNAGGDHEYNVVQSAESLPVILQNLEHAQLPMQQEQLIFITNSSDQVECSETEVITA